MCLTPALNAATTVLKSTYLLESNVGFATVAGFGLACGYLACKWTNDERECRYVDKILNDECGLATDHLEEGYGLNDQFEFEQPVEVAANEEPSQRGIARLDHRLIDVAQHRRVRPKSQLKYMNCVMAEVKAKFGTPSCSEANRKAVMRFASSLMAKHGLRPTHIKKYLPMIVDLSFVPNDAELASIRMLNSSASTKSKIDYIVNSCAGGFGQSC